MRRLKNGIIYCLSEREIISLEEQWDERRDKENFVNDLGVDFPAVERFQKKLTGVSRLICDIPLFRDFCLDQIFLEK